MGWVESGVWCNDGLIIEDEPQIYFVHNNCQLFECARILIAKIFDLHCQWDAMPGSMLDPMRETTWGVWWKALRAVEAMKTFCLCTLFIGLWDKQLIAMCTHAFSGSPCRFPCWTPGRRPRGTVNARGLFSSPKTNIFMSEVIGCFQVERCKMFIQKKDSANLQIPMAQQKGWAHQKVGLIGLVDWIQQAFSIDGLEKKPHVRNFTSLYNQ